MFSQKWNAMHQAVEVFLVAVWWVQNNPHGTPAGNEPDDPRNDGSGGVSVLPIDPDTHTEL